MKYAQRDARRRTETYEQLAKLLHTPRVGRNPGEQPPLRRKTGVKWIFSTNYLGLKLKHPIILGASPLAHDVDQAKQIAEAGASAIVLLFVVRGTNSPGAVRAAGSRRSL